MEHEKEEGGLGIEPGYIPCGDAVCAVWIAFGLFFIAAASDFLDGYLARAWHQQSAFGKMLDPIADKLLVGASILMLVYDQTITDSAIWAAIIILCREAVRGRYPGWR